MDALDEEQLDVPEEEERFCPNCSATPCEWFNWQSVLERYGIEALGKNNS